MCVFIIYIYNHIIHTQHKIKFLKQLHNQKMILTNFKVEFSNKIHLNKIFLLIISYFLFIYLNIINSAKIYSDFLFILVILITIFVLWDKSKKCLSSFIIIFLMTSIFFFTYKTRQFFYFNRVSISILNDNFFDSQYNVFFIETNKTRKEFNMKQFCAIESAAFNNPNANIYLYSMNASNIELLSSYPNIKYVKLIPELVFNGTKLGDWWKNNTNKILDSTYYIQDISDSIRLSLLWKYGGDYQEK